MGMFLASGDAVPSIVVDQSNYRSMPFAGEDGGVEGDVECQNKNRRQRLGDGREMFDDTGAEDCLPESRRPVDPQQLWSCGVLFRDPVQECRPVEDPVAGTDEPLLEGVVVALA